VPGQNENERFDKPKVIMRLIGAWLIFIGFLVSIPAQPPEEGVYATPCVEAESLESVIPLGVPINTSKNNRPANNCLMANKTYFLSYNNSRGAANWVFWHLDEDNLGTNPRTDDFRRDFRIKEKYQISNSSYEKTGYDRGHMCPAGDRSSDQAQVSETFLMSNMQPQVGVLNQHAWKNLEDDVRKMVSDEKEKKQAHIFAGCYGSIDKIFGDKITVPEKCFKIILLLSKGDFDINLITKDTTVIAVIIPNDSYIERKWQRYLKTVDEIEEETKLDFFTRLSPDIQNALEAKNFKDEGGLSDFEIAMLALGGTGGALGGISTAGIYSYLKRKRKNSKILKLLLRINWYLREKRGSFSSSPTINSAKQSDGVDQNIFAKGAEELENELSVLLNEMTPRTRWMLGLRNAIDLGQIERLGHLDEDIQRKLTKGRSRMRLRRKLREKTINLINAMLDVTLHYILFASGQAPEKDFGEIEKLIATPRSEIESVEAEICVELDKP
jgi:endonuclease G